MKVRVTARAKADISALFRLIQSYDETAALTFLTKINRGFETLAEFPESGQLCPEFGQGIRRKTISLTLVFYRIDDDALLILRAIDGRMDLLPQFRK